MDNSLIRLNTLSIDLVQIFMGSFRKANKILEQFGEYIEKVCIITRDNSIGDTPKITMYELSDGCEILYSEDWSKFIPSDYIIAASDSEIEGNGRAELKIENKHVKLKGRKEKPNRGNDSVNTTPI